MAYKYDTREVTHGNAFGFFSKISQDKSTGAVTFEKTYEWTGLVGTSFDPKQDSKAHYADNVEHIRLKGAKVIEGSITVIQIPSIFSENHLGRKKTDSGALLDTGNQASFVLGYAESVTDAFGTELKEWHIWTNVKAGTIKAKTSSDKDSAEPKQFEISATASANAGVLDKDGMAVTEIIWRDDATNKVWSKIDAMFGDNPTVTLAELIELALAKTTPPTKENKGVAK